MQDVKDVTKLIFSINDRERPESEIVSALDKMNIAIANVQNVLRYPTLPTLLSDDLHNRRRSAVRAIIRIRNLRDTHLGSDLFQDPAWNILLDCYASHLDGRGITVSDACVASGAPYTTALRWLRALEERGLILRKDDQTDRRRAFVSLSEETLQTVEVLVDQTIRSLSGFHSSLSAAPHQGHQS